MEFTQPDTRTVPVRFGRARIGSGGFRYDWIFWDGSASTSFFHWEGGPRAPHDEMKRRVLLVVVAVVVRVLVNLVLVREGAKAVVVAAKARESAIPVAIDPIFILRYWWFEIEIDGTVNRIL